VGGGGWVQVAVEVAKQPAGIDPAPFEILQRVPDVGDTEALGGCGDEMHQALDVLGGLALNDEVEFGLDDGQDQGWFQVKVGCKGFDQGDDVGAADITQTTRA
jgi:hypothetical protein